MLPDGGSRYNAATGEISFSFGGQKYLALQDDSLIDCENSEVYYALDRAFKYVYDLGKNKALEQARDEIECCISKLQDI